MMVTADGDEERRTRARELGAFEFITKPVDFDRLPGVAGCSDWMIRRGLTRG